jgi:hypothetical protein
MPFSFKINSFDLSLENGRKINACGGDINTPYAVWYKSPNLIRFDVIKSLR